MQETRDKLDALDAQMHTTQVSLIERSAELSTVQTRLREVGDIMKVLQEHSALAERVEELVKEVGVAKALLRGSPASPICSSFTHALPQKRANCSGRHAIRWQSSSRLSKHSGPKLLLPSPTRRWRVHPLKPRRLRYVV